MFLELVSLNASVILADAVESANPVMAADAASDNTA
jgi:hypothetical protein